jgi:hypothetical protein
MKNVKNYEKTLKKLIKNSRSYQINKTVHHYKLFDGEKPENHHCAMRIEPGSEVIECHYPK